MPAALMIGHHLSISALMIGRERRRILLIGREYDLAECFDAAPHGGIGQRGPDRAHRGDRRRPWACPLVVHRPCQNEMLSPGTPDFDHRRRVRRFRPALLAHHRIGLVPAGFHIGQRRRRFKAGQVDLAADQILHRRRGAAIGHVLQAARRSSARRTGRIDCAALPEPTVPNVVGSGLAFNQVISSVAVVRRQARSCRGSTAARRRASEIGCKSLNTSKSSA